MLLNFDLCDSVTPTRSIVGFGCVSSSHLITLGNEIKDLVVVVDELLLEAGYLNHVVLVLSDRQLLMLVEQIIYLTTVNFIHGDSDSKVPLSVLPVVDPSFKEVFNCNTLKAVHRVSFT